MPVTSMVHIAARRAVPNASFGAGPARPTAKALLDTIGIYIPADVTTMYIPVAAGMVAAGSSGSTKRGVALGIGIFAAFVTWVLAHRAAQKAAKETQQSPPSPGVTLRAGWFEIAAAFVAFMVWAWAMPGSWHAFGKNDLWQPALAVALASGLIGGAATLMNRDSGG